MSYALFDSLLEPVFTLNSEGLIIYCNETAATICGSSPRKLVRSKLSLSHAIQFESALEYLSDLKAITTPTPYKELKFSTETYENGKAQITIQPHSVDDNSTDYIVFFRDVTLEERLQNKYRAELEQKETYINELKEARNQLEIYSKDLESLVQKRTAEIQDLNVLMKALLDSLNQAFFVFDQSGLCAPFYSKACLEVLDSAPGGQNIWDVLKIERPKIEGFKNWLFTVFSEMLPFEDLKPLGPDKIPHQNKSISLEYFPIRNVDNKIEKIVCVGSDVTDLVQAQHQAESDREKVQSILKMIQNRRELKMFLLETQVQVTNLDKELEKLKADSNYNRDGILRILHTIKGGAATFSYNTLKETAHALEEKMIPSESLALDFLDVTPLQNTIESETSTVTAFYREVFGELSNSEEDNILLSQKDIQTLLKLQSLQDVRLFIEERAYTQPLQNLVNQFPIVIEKTAQLLNKKVAPLTIKNSSIRVPFKTFEPFFNSFIHVLRNSIDHGVESPDVRRSLNKKTEGTLSLEFSVVTTEAQKYLHIIYKDDGQGVNPTRIREKLDQKKILHAHLSDEDVIYFIFNPSFTTRDNVTETSGRGVGLDAVKHEVDQLGGSIKINSKLGHYTEFEFTLPYPTSMAEHKRAA